MPLIGTKQAEGKINSMPSSQFLFQNVCCQEWNQVYCILGPGVMDQQPVASGDPAGVAHLSTQTRAATYTDLHLQQHRTCIPVLQAAVLGTQARCTGTASALRNTNPFSQPGIIQGDDSGKRHDQISMMEL